MYGENYILLGIRRMKNKKKQASRLDLPVFLVFIKENICVFNVR